METQREAIVIDPKALHHVGFAEVGSPVLASDELLLSVHHASINHGDRVRATIEKPGTILGMDAAGIVLRAADDGSGPPVGARVAAFGLSTWATEASVRSDRAAIVPDAVELADATALATAGVTALRALRTVGPVLGRVVLVTGATGAVGRYAVQLAALAGAHVVAAVRSEAHLAGAHEVVVGLDGIAATRFPVDAVIETVGGATLVAALRRLAPGGCLASLGWASGEPASFPPFGTFAFGEVRTLVDASGIMFTPGVGRDLAVMLGQLRAGRVSAAVDWRGSWHDVHAALAATGKAVLDFL
jgi:NADPH:quinone reductase